jgi:hypothetical protein
VTSTAAREIEWEGMKKQVQALHKVEAERKVEWEVKKKQFEVE